MIYILYLIDFIGNLHFSLWLLIVGLTAYLGAQGLDLTNEFEEVRTIKILRATRIILVILLVTCFMPSEKTMYMMLGTKLMNESEVPSKVLAVVNKKLDEYLVEEKKK